VQLPAWNEALGLPRPWDQQWSLRLQQIVAYETDLLDYGDIFDGAPEIERKVASLKGDILAELERVRRLGGAVTAVESGYMKQRLVESNARRLAAIERGDQIVVGVNRYSESAPSPLVTAGEAGYLLPDTAAEEQQVKQLAAWRASRDTDAVTSSLAALKQAASEARNIMPASIECARAGATTGEWAQVLREVFGEYRAPTGIANAVPSRGSNDIAALRMRVTEVSGQLGRRLKFLVGKPGLDGHSSGAEQVALKARDAGFEVVYEGIRLTPAQIVNAALEEGVHVVGLSVLSGSHVPLVTEILSGLRAHGLGHVPVVVGGIIPPEDEAALKRAGVARVYTPKDYDLTAIIRDIVELVASEPQLAA
jgi:(2R)-ethylmalonyl-CoA mutase